jgi:hypothetical protein
MFIQIKYSKTDILKFNLLVIHLGKSIIKLPYVLFMAVLIEESWCGIVEALPI